MGTAKDPGVQIRWNFCSICITYQDIVIFEFSVFQQCSVILWKKFANFFSEYTVAFVPLNLDSLEFLRYLELFLNYKINVWILEFWTVHLTHSVLKRWTYKISVLHLKCNKILILKIIDLFFFCRKLRNKLPAALILHHSD